jgi:hypothetical protein
MLQRSGLPRETYSLVSMRQVVGAYTTHGKDITAYVKPTRVPTNSGRDICATQGAVRDSTVLDQKPYNTV